MTWTSTHRLPVKTNRQAIFGLRERSAHICGDSTEIQSVQVDSPNRLSPRILKNSYLCRDILEKAPRDTRRRSQQLSLLSAHS